jgi:membrane associated rhomboid family serine protease
MNAVSRRVMQPILLLVCLPTLLTFYYYKSRLTAEPLLLRVEASQSASGKWSAAAGFYLLRQQESANGNNFSNDTRLYSKPRDLFYPVEEITSIFIRESPSEPSCLHHSSPTIQPICSEGPTLEGNYYDSQGHLLVSVSRIQRQSAMAHPSNNKNWQLLTQHIPATCLLIALNVALAYIYWDRTVAPLSVANIYDSMVYFPFEIWRTLTGATAHFEIWHLGLNMMSFYSLGREIEPRVSSLVFLLFNISLMVIVTVLWLLLYYFHRGNQQRSPTVGYSGVIFSWIVVASLEQSRTCPVVFFPSLCFQTYKMGGFRFNFGPLVQLVVMQVLLPRVSFYGHLAGILAGFLIHWGVLPARLVQPSVLIPCLYCLYLHLFRKVSLKGALSVHCSLPLLPDQVCLAFQATLLCISAYVLRLDSVLDLGMTSFFWVAARLTDRDFDERQILTKATVVSAVVVVASDAIKLGFFSAFQGIICLNTITLVLRMIGLFWMLASSGVSELEADDGIFERTLSFVVLDFCRTMKRPVISGRTILPTSEEGHRLGGITSGGTGDRPVSRLLEMA